MNNLIRDIKRKIVNIRFDPDYIDCYTVVLKESIYPPNLCKEYGFNPDLKQCIGLGINFNSPNGFSQYSECMPGNHLGYKVNINSLPNAMIEHIHNRLFDKGEN